MVSAVPAGRLKKCIPADTSKNDMSHKLDTWPVGAARNGQILQPNWRHCTTMEILRRRRLGLSRSVAFETL